MANILPYKLALEMWTCAPDNTATGKTLAALKGSALNTNTRRIVIWEEGTSTATHMGIGSITNAAPLMTGNILYDLPVGTDLAATIRLFSTAGSVVNVIEMG